MNSYPCIKYTYHIVIRYSNVVYLLLLVLLNNVRTRYNVFVNNTKRNIFRFVIRIHNM